MFNFSYGPVGDFLGPDFIKNMQAFAKQQEKLKLMEKYQRPEGSSGYDFSGDREQLAQDMADLGYIDNNPMTMEALTSKYQNFLNDLYGVTPSGETSSKLPGIGRPPFLPPPGMGNTPSTEPPLLGTAVVGPFRNPDGSPMIAVDPEESRGPGIETLMPAEEEGYKKYISSDTNPFESMGISSLGQDALKQMIFERNNPQVNQSRGYKSYIG